MAQIDRSFIGEGIIYARAYQSQDPLLDIGNCDAFNISFTSDRQTLRNFRGGGGNRNVREIVTDVTSTIGMYDMTATNLARSLRFVLQALRRKVPCVVAVTLADEARRKGLSVDAAKLAARLGCAVEVTSGRTGEGVEQLARRAAEAARAGLDAPAHVTRLSHLPSIEDDARVAAWCSDCVRDSVGGQRAVSAERLTDRVDAALTHPVSGGAVFIMVMAVLFASIFWLARFPMDAIDWVFQHLGGLAEAWMPEGPLRALLVDGVVGGVAGTVVFLPQIALLFFMLSLLEDSGYLARAAFAADRFMRRFGLPGQAFVPLLSSHACALPGILSTRLIPDPKDRLAELTALLPKAHREQEQADNPGLWEFKSSRAPSKSYRVTFGRAGHLECTCEGFLYRGNCKHVQEIRAIL